MMNIDERSWERTADAMAAVSELVSGADLTPVQSTVAHILVAARMKLAALELRLEEMSYAEIIAFVRAHVK